MPPSQKINTPPLPDLILGSSKGYHLARRWNIPLIRVGFPIHDRIGAPHQSLLAYQGASRLFERIVNSLLASLQHPSKNNTTPPPPYQYM